MIDHVAIAAAGLEAGAAVVAGELGLPLEAGGKHAAMGTHNRLLSLGPTEYLEVIAIDPAAPPPRRSRWFGLDAFDGPPRPVAWIISVQDMEAARALAPAGIGPALDLERGDLHWSLTVPEGGVGPFDGLFPALIRWHGPAHPAPRLTDRGARLAALELHHPRAEALRAGLSGLVADPRVTVHPAERPAIRLTLRTPTGTIVLQ
ncbi:MAG: VOC family protein [Gemmobacter sp.]